MAAHGARRKSKRKSSHRRKSRSGSMVFSLNVVYKSRSSKGVAARRTRPVKVRISTSSSRVASAARKAALAYVKRARKRLRKLLRKHSVFLVLRCHGKQYAFRVRRSKSSLSVSKVSVSKVPRCGKRASGRRCVRKGRRRRTKHKKRTKRRRRYGSKKRKSHKRRKSSKRRRPGSRKGCLKRLKRTRSAVASRRRYRKAHGKPKKLKMTASAIAARRRYCRLKRAGRLPHQRSRRRRARA